MRRHILSGLIAAATTLTASSAFAGCCNTSYGYGYGYGGFGSGCCNTSYGYGGYGYSSYGYGGNYGGYGTGVTYNVPAVSITVPATVGYSYPAYRPSYFANQGPTYTGPNVTEFAQPYYTGEGYSYPYGYPGASGVRTGYTSYPYVRNTWSSWRWRQPYARPYAGRSYVSWRYQSQYRGYRPVHRYATGYLGGGARPHIGPRRPYGY